jgi:aspartyl-tRNA(Asn)/glutamyl-tRNA(Gln) amidotransferase subunit C
MPVEIDIEHVARLARLRLTEEERDRLRSQLVLILEAAAAIGGVATNDVPPTASAVPRSNVFRPDEPEPCLSRDVALGNAPAQEDGRFRVPPIAETE